MSVSRVTTCTVLIAVANTRRDPMRIILRTLFSIRRTLREKRSQGGVTFARTAERYVYVVSRASRIFPRMRMRVRKCFSFPSPAHFRTRMPIRGTIRLARETNVYAVFKNAKLSLSCSVVPPRRVARGFEFGLRFFPFFLFFLGFFRRIENRTPYP